LLIAADVARRWTLLRRKALFQLPCNYNMLPPQGILAWKELTDVEEHEKGPRLKRRAALNPKVLNLYRGFCNEGKLR
jgi:hypothetical protein